MKTISGWLAALALTTVSAPLSAQTAASPPAATGSEQENQNEVIKMSAFEVTTTQGIGYGSGTAATAFKTDQNLMDIPQSDLVVTNDLITDLNYENSSDTLRYVGVGSAYQGEAVIIRGASAGGPYLDDTPTDANYDTSNFTDSYEVVKGPAQTLYLNAPVNGVTLRATKKPLPYDYDVVTGEVNEWGNYRLTGDFTGPVGKIGDTVISYRTCLEYQHGPTYFTNIPDDRDNVFAEFQVSYKNTTIRAYYSIETIHGEVEGSMLLTPDGGLYTGAGWKASNQIPNTQLEYEVHSLHTEFLQKVSDNWEMKLDGTYWYQRVFGPLSYAQDVDYTDGTETFTADYYNQWWKYWTVLGDMQGHYEIAGIANRDAFGFAFADWVVETLFWATGPFPYPNGPADGSGSVTVPYDSLAAVNSIVAPPTSAFTEPTVAQGGAGSYIESELSDIYWQHTVDVIPNWLTLLAGFTWDNAEVFSNPDISIHPKTPVDVQNQVWLHRLAAILHLTSHVSVYAMESTTFTPSTTNTIFEDGLAVPPLQAKGTELGVKWNFLGGRISGESSWFKAVTSNEVNPQAGLFPNGEYYAEPIGSVVGEGVDGDATFNILPGWQWIASAYAGHNRDSSNNPVPYSFDNSWGTFMRYEFSRISPLKGWSFGGGVNRLSGMWEPTIGEIASFPVPAIEKLKQGTMLNGFVTYRPSKHWLFRVNCQNILNQAFPLDAATPYIVDPSMPRTWSFEIDYKF